MSSSMHRYWPAYARRRIGDFLSLSWPLDLISIADESRFLPSERDDSAPRLLAVPSK
jgi:hypothetical protein